jgi:hypothetical protein
MSTSRENGRGRALAAGILAGFVCILLAIVLPPLPAQSAPISPLPPRPAPAFPPRPTTPVPLADEDDEPVGAYIELQAQGAPDGVWTVIQWQDSARAWHDVEGWRSTLDEGGRRVWWVAGADFGTGPFRWAVYQSPDGDLLAESETFYLPNSAGETVTIEVSLHR